MKLLSAPLSLILFYSSIGAGHASVLSHTSVLDMVEDVNVRAKLDINDQQIQYLDNNKCIRKGNRVSATMYDISTESCGRVEDGWDFKSIEGETYVIKLKGTDLCLGGISDIVILSECADPPRSQSQTWNIIREDDTKPVRFLNKVAQKCMKLNERTDIFTLVECNLIRDQRFILDKQGSPIVPPPTESPTESPTDSPTESQYAIIKTRMTKECMNLDRENLKDVIVSSCLSNDPTWFHWYSKSNGKKGYMLIHRNTQLCLTSTKDNTVSTAPCDKKQSNQMWEIGEVEEQLKNIKADKCMSLSLATKKLNLAECKSNAEKQLFDAENASITSTTTS